LYYMFISPTKPKAPHKKKFLIFCSFLYPSVGYIKCSINIY
jgi:hypothetical protein